MKPLPWRLRPSSERSSTIAISASVITFESSGRAESRPSAVFDGSKARSWATRSTAARVAERASSTRCLRSLSSTSVAAPTLITATELESLPKRSWAFSRSQSLLD